MFNKTKNHGVTEMLRLSQDMKQLIIEALQDIDIDKGINQTKQQTTSLEIEGMTLAELQKAVIENNVPEDATISYNGDWQGDYMNGASACMEWVIQVPTTEKDKEKQRRTMFEHRAWKAVYDKLTNNGYKRVGGNSTELRRFINVSRYDLFIKGDYDTLSEYYALSFTPL